MKKESTSTWALASLVAIATLAVGCATRSKAVEREMGRWAEEAPQPPVVRRLNVPTSKIVLPALIVGESQQLSSSCFKPVEQLEEGGLDQLSQDFIKQEEYKASLKAEFEKALVKVGMEASLARAFMQEWHLEAQGFTLSRVDPADVRPNFSNSACTLQELGFFTDKRRTVTGALKAAEIKVKATKSASAEHKLKLAAAIEKINLELGIDFSSSASTEGGFELSGKNVYIGILETPLTVKRCRISDAWFKTGESASYCKDSYQIVLEALPGTDQFKWKIARSGEHGEYAEHYSAPQWRPFGEFQLASINVNKELRGSADILLVGISGQ